MTVPCPTARRPVRVAFVIDSLGRAGTESQLVALLTGLDRAAVEPSLVLLDGTPDSSRELEPAGVPVLRLGVTKLLGGTGARAAGRLLTAWRRDTPDVVQAYFLDSVYLAAPVARAAGVRRVVRVRNNLGYWLTPKHRVLGTAVRPLVDVTLTNSAAGRDALVGRERLPRRRVAVLENGVDLDRYAGLPEPFTSGAVRVGCVANLRPVKNIDGLLRAARVVCERLSGAAFSVAGDGPERPRLESLRDALGLAGRFTFLGSVADVPSYLGQVDVTVLPSHSESMSNSLLECLAAGRAVVATDAGANRELVGAGGVIVPPGDDAALAGAILGLASDRARARSLAAAGRDGVAARFGRAAMCRRFERFFAGLVTK